MSDAQKPLSGIMLIQFQTFVPNAYRNGMCVARTAWPENRDGVYMQFQCRSDDPETYEKATMAIRGTIADLQNLLEGFVACYEKEKDSD